MGPKTGVSDSQEDLLIARPLSPLTPIIPACPECFTQAVFNWVHLARAELATLEDDIEYSFSASDLATIPSANQTTAAAAASDPAYGRLPSANGVQLAAQPHHRGLR